jgi:two-component system alkaline phosphatase synthesis response regulator PhoP
MSKSVLIVEDEETLQDVYKIILSSEGYDVHTASNGVEGLQKVKALRPDLVLLDVFMPVMDGKEFMRNIDMTEYPDTKVLVCSNLSDRKVENELLTLGAHKFVLKSSMSPRDLLALVTQVLST